MTTAKRIGRDKNPTDMAFEMIKQSRTKLDHLGSIADTEEFREIANFMESQYKCGTPRMDLSDTSWNFSTYEVGVKSYAPFDEAAGKLAHLNKADYAIANEDRGDTPNKTYRMRWDFEDGKIFVHIVAYLDTGSCERVKVGTKTVDVYEMRCAPSAEVLTPDQLPAPVLALEGRL